MEIDVDAISDGKDVYVAGIMQHMRKLEFIQVTLHVVCRQYQLKINN